MSAMKRAAIYLRVSTAAQATRGREPEGYSIPAQREACQGKAAELDAEVVGEYVDRGESAKTADRPELKELLARLEAKRDLDYVIVHKVDRLARNRYDDATITYALHEAGAELVSVTENIDRTPVGAFMHAIVAANAEFYSANLAAEAKKGQIQKAKLGGTPTKAPLGYLNVRKLIEGHEIRTVEIDPERAPHVRWAFAAYGSGAYTLDTLLAALTERGLRTRPTPKKPEKPLSRTQLASMLQNPYYVGVVRYARVEYEGRHEHLIDQHTFAKAKAVLAAHASSSEKDRKHHHYLKGSLYCGRCGSRMSFTYAKGNGGGYAYFYCLGRTRGTGCEQPYVPVDLIETAVENAYGDVRLPRKQTERVRGKLSHALGGMREQAEAEATRQRKRLAKLTEKREKLLHAYYAGAVPIDQLRQEQDRLTIEANQAERHIEVAEASFTDIEDTLGKALDLLADCQRAYLAAPGHLRRQWNQALFERLVVYDDRIGEAEIAEPFATLADPELPKSLGGKVVTASAVSSGAGSSEAIPVEDAGLKPLGFHEGRHTYASIAIAAGLNPKTLSTYLGHATITITLDRYGHLMPGSEVEARAMLDAYLDAPNTSDAE